MDDRSHALANVFVGILLGGALGYLCLTKTAGSCSLG